jgi:hypothetical protein
MFSMGSLRRSYLEDHLRYQSVSSVFSVEDNHGKFVVEKKNQHVKT